MKSARIVRPAVGVRYPHGIRLSVWPGLGDTLQMVTVAYSLAEHGIPVSLAYNDTPEGVPVTRAPLEDLPLLPLLESARGGAPHINLHAQSSAPYYRWTAQRPMVDSVLSMFGLQHISTPRHACLQPAAADVERARAGIGSPYLLIAPMGHWLAVRKALSRAQVQAAANVARDNGLVPVLVGAHGWPALDGVVDLSGQTSIPDLIALVAGAQAVLCAETGILHLAGALNVPALAVCPDESLPRAALCEYPAAVTLQAPAAAQVPVVDVIAGLGRLITATRVPWGVTGSGAWPCGLEGEAKRIRTAAGVPERAEITIREYFPRNRWPDENEVVVSIHKLPESLADLPPAVVYLCRQSSDLRRLRAAGKPAFFAPLTTMAAEPAPLRERPRTVAWQGIVVPRKGLDALFAWWPDVRQVIPDARLVLFASEHRPANLPAGAECRFRPAWPEEELAREMGEADLFVYSDQGDKEQSGASVTAMAFGRPVLVSSSSAHHHMRRWGYTADGPEAIIRVLRDAKLYRQLSQQALAGSSYRRPAVIAGTYRALAVRAAYERAK